LRARDWRTRAGLAALGVAIVTTGVIAAPRLAALARGRPTDSAEAYRYYLRGRELEQAGRVAAADTLYDRALVLDPDFALARARLAHIHLVYTPRPDSARLERARREAMAALRLQPGLADAHFALGIYWQRREQHERALAEFDSAGSGMRNSAALHRAIAVSYRALGRWEDAVTALERVRELEPMNVDYAQQLAFTYSRLRRYGEATNAWDRYIALNPDAYTAMMIRGHVFVRWQGTADTLAAALERLPDGWDGNGMASLAHFMVARLRRTPEQGLAALTASTHTLSEDDLVYFPHALMRAMLHDDAGDSLRARATYDTARIALQDSLALHPDDPRMHIAHGLALAALDRRREAMNAATRALSLAPTKTDVVRGTAFMGGAAMIYAMVGENDAALGLIERLLRMPAGREASVPLLRADPAWDPLRGDPRFRELLIRYAPE
jgi:tetratricopeptide (TPR) repeat protein